jgi:hypothetical protein
LCFYLFSRGDFGRLGHGNSSDLFTPQPIKALNGLRIKQIACGDSHCLAVTMEGEVQRLVIFPNLAVFVCLYQFYNLMNEYNLSEFSFTRVMVHSKVVASQFFFGHPPFFPSHFNGRIIKKNIEKTLLIERN